VSILEDNNKDYFAEAKKLFKKAMTVPFDVGAAAVEKAKKGSSDFFEEFERWFGNFSTFLVKCVVVIFFLLVVYFAVKYCTKNLVQRINSGLCCDDFNQPAQHPNYIPPPNHQLFHPFYREPHPRGRGRYHLHYRFSHPVDSYPLEDPLQTQGRYQNGYETDQLDLASDITPKAPKRQRRSNLYASRDDSLLTSSGSSDSQRGKKRANKRQGSERQRASPTAPSYNSLVASTPRERKVQYPNLRSPKSCETGFISEPECSIENDFARSHPR